jgi:probable HAF family extracellular repeat protein
MRLSTLGFLVCLVSVTALAQGTYTQIDVPGAIATFARGVDSFGEIVGGFQDSNGFVHGFLLSNAAYRTIDYPGAASTVVNGINDQNQLVGESDIAGFVYDISTKVFTPLNYPGANGVTVAMAINNAGTIGGYFAQSSGGVSGFMLSEGTYTSIAPPGTKNSAVLGISGAGLLVGFAVNGATNTGLSFYYKQGQYGLLRVPHYVSTFEGVSNSGITFAGDYGTSVPKGFVYRGANPISIAFPGASSTAAIGCNDSGQVVGFFTDSGGTHGFLWTPPAGSQLNHFPNWSNFPPGYRRF